MIYTGLNNTGEVEAIYGHLNGVKSEVSEVYGSIGYNDPIFYKHQTLTGTSPLTFRGLGQQLKDYHIFGETVQDGTPSPDYPVDVQGVGDLVNLYETMVFHQRSIGITANTYQQSVADIVNSAASHNAKQVEIGHGIKCIISFDTDGNVSYGNYIRFALTDDDLSIADTAYNIWTFQNGGNDNMLQPNQHYEFEMENTDHNFLITQSLFPSCIKNIKIDVYKIPVTIGGTTTPIYIGSDPLYRVGEYADEIASDGTLTRRNDVIDILADTSKLSYVGWFRKGTSYEYRCFRFQRITGVRKGVSNCFLTHNTYYDGLRGPGEVTFVYADSYFAINFSVPAHIDTVEKCIQWLTDIYESTGKRPVFVCPISTSTTEQATIPSISTIAGDNTLTVDTTVKPSAVSITGGIKPTGYGQLLDVNDVDIQDSTGEPVYIQG